VPPLPQPASHCAEAGRLLRDFSWRSIERVFLAPTIG
jgi:hypothetical protein